jgi:protein gp37
MTALSTPDSRLSTSRAGRGLYWDRAWNLIGGCTPIDAECDRCWAAAEAQMRGGQKTAKVRAMYGGLTRRGRFTGEVRFREDLLDAPLRVKPPATWALWTDLFHEALTARQIARAFAVMTAARQHRFLACTKRPGAAGHFLDARFSAARWAMISKSLEGLQWSGRIGLGRQHSRHGLFQLALNYQSRNVALGTTVGHARAMPRLDSLLAIGGRMLFLSIEPLLERLWLKDRLLSTLDPRLSTRPGECRCGHVHELPRGPVLGGIDRRCPRCPCPGFAPAAGIQWAVIGCESGSGRRPCRLDWVYSLVEQLRSCGVAIWIKQLDLGRRIAHRLEEFPDDLRIRERPEWWWGS